MISTLRSLIAALKTVITNRIQLAEGRVAIKLARLPRALRAGPAVRPRLRRTDDPKVNLAKRARRFKQALLIIVIILIVFVSRHAVHISIACERSSPSSSPCSPPSSLVHNYSI